MKQLASTVLEQLRRLDDLAKQDAWLQRASTSVKLILTLVLIVLVTSYERYEIVRQMPFVALVLVFTALAQIPLRDLVLRFLSTMPLILGFGLFNLFFDSRGLEALVSLTLKTFICVSAGFALIASSGIASIAASLRRARFPQSLCTQLVIMWSYLAILFEELGRVWRAYSLRAARQRGVAREWWGSLAGQALIRSEERSRRVYSGMQMRGFDGSYPVDLVKPLNLVEATIAILLATCMIALRFVDTQPFGAYLAQVVG